MNVHCSIEIYGGKLVRARSEKLAKLKITNVAELVYDLPEYRFCRVFVFFAPYTPIINEARSTLISGRNLKSLRENIHFNACSCEASSRRHVEGNTHFSVILVSFHYGTSF